MLDRILPNNLTIKSLAQQDDALVNDIVKKAKPSKEKEREYTFNYLVEERINDEKNQQVMRKKAKKTDDINLFFMPVINQNIPMVNQQYIVRFRKDNKNRCVKCGNIVDNDDGVEINQKGKNVYVCSKCMNNEIKDFLTYNYL